MKAITPPQHTHSNAKNYSTKELITVWSVVAHDPADHNAPLKEIISTRWYTGKSNQASTVYCNLYLYADCRNNGTGKAGGYGYDKQSAALQDAIESAGVKLDTAIDGRGSSASREALEAIAVDMGYKTFLIVEN